MTIFAVVCGLLALAVLLPVAVFASLSVLAWCILVMLECLRLIVDYQPSVDMFAWLSIFIDFRLPVTCYHEYAAEVGQ